MSSPTPALLAACTSLAVTISTVTLLVLKERRLLTSVRLGRIDPLGGKRPTIRTAGKSPVERMDPALDRKGFLIGQPLSIEFCLKLITTRFPKLLGTPQPKEKRRIKAELPDLMDLLALYSSSGESLTKGVEALAARFTGGVFSYLPEVVHEIHQGHGVAEALSRAFSRFELEDVTLMITALARAESAGTPIGKTLRLQARFLRQRQRIEAEKRASLIPFKVSLCTAFLLLPSALLVVMVPNLLVFVRSWG
ncbi:MAG TPA: type II secretion system F family protein [Clostridia bacterium]|nr:type II secretion system F family protein [Clostridia bacterium]